MFSKASAPWVTLGAAMIVSVAATLYFGRGTTFSGDEMVWVVTSPGFDLKTAFQPHAGHLLLVPRVVYVPLLDLFGLAYWPYRVLTVLSVCLTVGLLFRYLLERVPAAVALVPCVILLFFGTDHLHMLQGNGFTICFSLSMGLTALLMFERNDRFGDIAATVALVIAAATYSVGLPFIAGIGIGIILARQWRRLWVPAIPSVLYVVWYIWSKSLDYAGPKNNADPAQLLELPKWVIQAAGASLYGLSGLDFDWSRGDTLDLIGLPATLIAFGAVVAVAWCIAKGRGTRTLWMVLTIGLVLWGLQVLVSGEGARLPDDARYLYPGAVVCLLILGEALRNLKWRQPALVAVYVLGAVGLLTNFVLLERNGGFYREQAAGYTGIAGTVELTAEAQATKGRITGPPTDLNLLVTEPRAAGLAMASSPYGHFAATPEEMLERSPANRRTFDQALFATEEVKTSKAPNGRLAGCADTEAGSDGLVVAPIGRTGGVVSSTSGIADLRIARFADDPFISLGPLDPSQKVRVTLLPDSADVPWRVGGAGKQLTVCPTGRK